MLRYLTSGETHGKCLTVILEGMPSGVKIDVSLINKALADRQSGYGRGGRMQIEKDTVEILSGIRGGYTLGSPIAMKIENKDWENWSHTMGEEFSDGSRNVDCPRPGHADLTGGLKYDHHDLRNVLERASARETATRVAVGALVKQLLTPFGIEFNRRVVSIGEITDTSKVLDNDFYKRAYSSPVGFGDKSSEKSAMEYIDKIKADGESIGGVVEVNVKGVIPGLGSYTHYDRKLDANIAFSVMSVQAIKGVEFGMGFDCATKKGSLVHDEITYDSGFKRKTNNAGGIEGGMSNGEDIIVRAAMKPIPTLYNPLCTVNLKDKTGVSASVERSDICAVPACSVVVESVVAYEIAKAFLEKFGSDCMNDLVSSFESYKKRISDY